MSQPELTVKLTSFPESNGKRNWTAMFVRKEKWNGLPGNCGGITIDRGECWNRIAYHAEEARFLIGERDDAPELMDYADDIHTPEEWKGEVQGDLQRLVNEALNNAVANRYDFDNWTAKAVAEDLIIYDADLEKHFVKDITPCVRKWYFLTKPNFKIVD